MDTPFRIPLSVPLEKLAKKQKKTATPRHWKIHQQTKINRNQRQTASNFWFVPKAACALRSGRNEAQNKLLWAALGQFKAHLRPATLGWPQTWFQTCQKTEASFLLSSPRRALDYDATICHLSQNYDGRCKTYVTAPEMIPLPPDTEVTNKSGTKTTFQPL